MNKKTSLLLDSLGARLKQTRLNANLTQQELADIIGKSRTAIERAEKGKCNLSTFVSILVALDADEQLELFLPPPPPSPVLLAKAKGKKRQRASSGDVKKSNPGSGTEDELGW
jgi:transcriptional regulator with XRE-family HTH domain